MLGEMLKAQGKDVTLSTARIEDRASLIALVFNHISSLRRAK